jgi:hypothetical protein
MIFVLLYGTLIFVCGTAFFCFGVGVQFRIFVGLARREYASLPFWANMGTIVILLLINSSVHLVEIGLWAGALMLCGEFSTFEKAYYHSAVNYTSLGYGDIVMSETWRLLGPLETLSGMLFFGVSTALLFAVLNRFLQQRLRQLKWYDQGHVHGALTKKANDQKPVPDDR